MIIAGIGSRETPITIIEEMIKIGYWCKENKFRVRSGHADGADYAFELGAEEYCDVYLPWKGFNDKLISVGQNLYPNDIIDIKSKLDKITNLIHPNPSSLTSGARLLMNRNVCQILGITVDDPVKYVVCWTADGGFTGGTGQALRIALKCDIPIFNMYYIRYSTYEKIVEQINIKERYAR